MVIVATTGDVPVLSAVKAGMVPAPLAANPIPILSFVQLKVAPNVPLIVMAVVVTLWQKL